MITRSYRPAAVGMARDTWRRIREEDEQAREAFEVGRASGLTQPELRPALAQQQEAEQTQAEERSPWRARE